MLAHSGELDDFVRLVGKGVEEQVFSRLLIDQVEKEQSEAANGNGNGNGKARPAPSPRRAAELSVEQKRAVEDWVLGALVP